MRKIVYLGAFVSIAILLTGCSKTPAATTTQNTTNTNTATEISEVDPLLKQTGFDRVQLTDPALFGYNQTSSNTTGTIAVPSGQIPGQQRIGTNASFNENSDLSITGSAQIVSQEKIAVRSFNYNGSCGAVTLSLTNRDSQTKQIAKLKSIATAISNTQFDLNIPSNITLIQFDTIGVYCQNQENPVSVAAFNN